MSVLGMHSVPSNVIPSAHAQEDVDMPLRHSWSQTILLVEQPSAKRTAYAINGCTFVLLLISHMFNVLKCMSMFQRRSLDIHVYMCSIDSMGLFSRQF